MIGYVYVPVACIYLLLASLTYYQIFKKIKENRRKARELKEYIENRRKSQERREYISKDQPIKKKTTQIQIFLPSFIILTFILFCIFPIFLTLLHDFIFTDTGWLMSVLLVLMGLGWVADPLIYIFSLKSVRRKIQQNFMNFKEVTTSRGRVFKQSK